MSKRDRIIELNDRLRTTFRGGRVELHPAVHNLDPQLRGRALWAMTKCTTFATTASTTGNLYLAGYSFEWHIEYGSKDGTGVSSDPADTDETIRVLTLYVVEDLLAEHDHPEPAPRCMGAAGAGLDSQPRTEERTGAQTKGQLWHGVCAAAGAVC